GTKQVKAQIEVACAGELAFSARGVPAGDDPHAQKAEFGDAESSQSAVDKWLRSDCLHPRRGAQPAGTLDRAGARWQGEGFAGGAVPYCAWHPGRRGRGKETSKPLEIRGKKAERSEESRRGEVILYVKT